MGKHSEGRKKFVGDTILFLLSPAFHQLSGFVVLMIIAKYLGAEGFGIWTQIQVTISLLSAFVTLNLGHSMNRFFAGEKDAEYLKQVFTAILFFVGALSVLIGLGMSMFARPAAYLIFKDTSLSYLLVLFGPLLFVRSIRAELSAFLTARRFTLFLRFMALISSVLLPLSVVAMLVLFREILWGAIGFLAASFFLIILNFYFIWKKGIQLGWPDFKRLIPLLCYGVPLLFTSIGVWVVQVSDRYILTHFEGIEAVGIYAANYSLAMLISSLWVGGTSVLLPDFAALYEKGEKEELEKRFGRVLKYGIAASAGAVGGLFVLGNPVFRFFVSEDIATQGSILLILSLAIVCYGLLLLFSRLFDILKKVWVQNQIWFGIAMLNLMLNVALIPMFGIMGAALATLISFACGLMAAIWYVRKHFYFTVKLSWIWKTMVAAGCMVGAIYFLPASSGIWTIGVSILGSAVYAGALFLLRFIDTSEMALLKEVLRHPSWLKF